MGVLINVADMFNIHSTTHVVITLLIYDHKTPFFMPTFAFVCIF